jgi:hypothetical protein
MTFSKKQKGQGAMEYLLLIGATIIIAISVIILITNMNASNREAALEQDKAITTILDNTLVPPIVTSVDCEASGDVTINLVSSAPNTGYRIKIDNNDPYPTGTDVLYVQEGTSVLKVSASQLGTTSPGTEYEVSVITVKNNVHSRPSTPASSCVAR